MFEVYEKAQINAYRHLIEHVQDAVMRFSPDGTVLFTSRSAEKLFGCRRFELRGRGWSIASMCWTAPPIMTAFAEANEDGRTRRVEIRMRRDEAGASAAAPRLHLDRSGSVARGRRRRTQASATKWWRCCAT